MAGCSDSHGVEQHLQGAFRRGDVLDLRSHVSDQDDPASGSRWGPERQIHADAIAELLLGSTEPAAGRTAVLHLIGARIIGKLKLRYSAIEYPLIIEDCFFDEPIDFSHLHAVSLSLRGSQIPSVTGYSLQVDGDLDCITTVTTSIDIFGARIGGRFWLNGAHLIGPDGGWALNAPDISVDGGMYCRGGFTATGGINLFGATIGATLEFHGATLTNPTGYALRAPGLTVKSDMTCTDGFIATGEIDFFGAQIGGQLWLNNAHLDHGERGWTLNAPLLTIGGGMYCRSGFTATGGINLFGATIGATLEFHGATLTNPTGYALRAPGLTVKSDMTCTGGFTASGMMDLSGARIDGQFMLAAATVGDVTADLRYARVHALRGESSDWPDRLRLNELSYDSLQPYLPATRQLRWLKRDPDGYHPQPYEQLAATYRKLGHDEQARTVLLAKQRHRRKDLHLPAKVWGYTQDAFVGYGYRPTRAFVWLAILVTVTAVYFAAHPPHAVNTAAGPRFQPVIYALDILLPILDLGQEKAYTATGTGEWVTWLIMLIGWILATAVIAGVTRILTRT